MTIQILRTQVMQKKVSMSLRRKESKTASLAYTVLKYLKKLHMDTDVTHDLG